MALFSIHFCGNKSFSTHKNSFLSFRSLSFCATCSFYFFSQFLSHFSPSENFPYNSICQRNSKWLTVSNSWLPPTPPPQLPGVSSMTTRICGVESWTSSIISVRQSLDSPENWCAKRKGTFSWRVVAPLGGVLNDKSGQFGLRLEERQTKLSPK